MSDLRDRARFKEQLEKITSSFRASLVSASPTYVGTDSAEPLEHATRRHVIDILLTALGWTLSQHGHDILEEAQAKGEATLFLDYLGVNPRSRAPLLIVEAKAWSKPFASPSTGCGLPGRHPSLPAARRRASGRVGANQKRTGS